MAEGKKTVSFETTDGRSFWVRFEPGGKHGKGAAAPWPPRGWICAPEGQSLGINATRPDLRDAIAHATRVGPDQPWVVEVAERVQREAGPAAK